MIDPNDFRHYVVRPTLTCLHPPVPVSRAAEVLLLGTALVESGLSALMQRGGGPALGLYQIEPATHVDLWDRYLAYRPALARHLRGDFGLRKEGVPRDERLITNLAYATAIARLIYWRRPEPLPDAADMLGLGAYWKQHYNSSLGAGRAAHFSSLLDRHLA